MAWRLYLALFWLAWMSLPQPAAAQEGSSTPSPFAPAVTELPTASPTPLPPGLWLPPAGQPILRGQVSLSGGASAPWRLDFSYRGETSAWFPLAASQSPQNGILLPLWDTTALTDGFYTLRLLVFSAEPAQEYRLDVEIRNKPMTDTPTITFTPSQTPVPTITFTPAPTATVTNTPFAALTPLPTNPAVLPAPLVSLHLATGILVSVTTFGLLGIIFTLYQKIRRL